MTTVYNSLIINNLLPEETDIIVSSFEKEECDFEPEWRSNFLSTFCPEPDYTITPVALTFPDMSASCADSPEDMILALVNAPSIRDNSFYDWRIQNWGTRAEFYDVSLELDDSPNDFCCSFYTKSGPPIAGLRAISRQFPNAIFILQYYSFESSYCGVSYVINGTVHDLSCELDFYKDLWFEEFYPDLFARSQEKDADNDDDLQDQLMDIWTDHEQDAIEWILAPAHKCLRSFLLDSQPPVGPIELKLGSFCFEVEPEPLPPTTPPVMSHESARRIAEGKFAILNV